MKKNPAPESGFSRLRVLFGCLFGAVGVLLAFAGIASTPTTGTLTPTSGPLSYTAGPFTTPNESPLGLGQLDQGPRCNAQFPCDSYTLTVTLPVGYTAAHPNAAVKVALGWTDTSGKGTSEYDLYIFNGVVGNTTGAMPAAHQSATSNNPQVANISPLADGTNQYSIKIVPSTPSGETVHAVMELQPGSGNGGGNGGGVPFGSADPTVPGAPRFQNFYAPNGTSAQTKSGEFNIGYNPKSGRIMVMNSGPIYRLTPPERLAQAKPECCDALWEDKSSTVTNTGLDPILWTDQKSGRTFASNATAGPNALYAYSDNDGDSYVQAGVSLPNGGADHQTIGTGPYPASLSTLGTAVNQGEAVYYCSQDIVGPASCARSDTLGTSYGPGVLAYTGNGLTQTSPPAPGGLCGGLHGHLHVAPDGTAWLPVNKCGGLQGGVFSTDGGMSWVNFTVPNGFSQGNGADPSIAIDADSTIYYSYVKNEPVAANNPTEGHPHIAVGQRVVKTDPITQQPVSSINWLRDIDVGTGHGIVNAAQIEAVGGSSGRAGVGFIATNVPGDYQAMGFPGKWYAFIATTSDVGNTWTTVNATPNDPVQNMTGVWQQGGGATDRNLLDFNEITVDDRGRVLYGYSDGCVSEGCILGTAANDFTAFMRVARQTGGRSLFASNDGNTDTTAPVMPKAPCLSGTRDASGVNLTWKAPDNGGSDVLFYQIFRSTASGAEVHLVDTTTPITRYNDTTASPSVSDYFYRVTAVNAVSTPVTTASAPVTNPSNEVDLQVTVPPPVGNLCIAPGLTLLTDPAGDSTLSPASRGTDLLSLQVAQPYQADGVPRLVFTINTDPGMSPQPAGSAWYVAMKFINGTSTTYKAVRMTWSGASPTFESYTPSADNSGKVDGRFATAGTSKALESGSSYSAPYSQIVLVVKASDLGVAPGATISGFVVGAGQSSDPANVGAGVTQLYDMMPDSDTFTGSYTVADNNSTCSPLQAVVSRKTHGTAGDFDIPLPLAGNAGIECRTGGSNGAHTLVYTLDRTVSLPGTASVTYSDGTTAVGSGNTVLGPSANQVTVNLLGIPNAQHILVTLNGVQDPTGAVLNGLAARLDVLLGDISGNGRVDATDTGAARQQSLQPVTSSNFRADVTANGRNDASDVAATRQQSLTYLP